MAENYLQVTTATPCGHLACWTCLLEGLKATGECVVCRCSLCLVIGFHVSFLCSVVHFRFSLSPALNCYNIINATRVTNKDNHRQCWSIPNPRPQSLLIIGPFPIQLSLVLMMFLFAPFFPQETGGASHCDTLQELFLKRCHTIIK